MANEKDKSTEGKLQSNENVTDISNNNLSFDETKQSYELDVKGNNIEYQHAMPYETVAVGAKDDDSTYDNSNPYVGDEYAKDDEIVKDELNELGMHVDSGQSVKLNAEDKILAHTPEDDRDDLDEEGYPVNDKPNK